MRSPRLAIVGNPGSIHVSRWARHFAEHGYDVTVVTFYPTALREAPGLQARSLRARRSATADGGTTSAGRPARGALVSLAPGAMRLASALRFRLAGIRRVLKEIRPDVVHAHYLSDYGFLAATAGFRPLVTSAWGSDVLRDPRESRVTRRIVRWVIGESALITFNADALADACVELGAPRERLLKVVFGVDRAFLEAGAGAAAEPRGPVIVSHRSLDRTLFNVDVIVSAMPEVLRSVPDARLLIGHTGRLEAQLNDLARRLGVASSVEFIGRASDERDLASRFARAAVYVAIPDSDGSSVTLLEAMAAGAYPVLSDIASNREWIAPDGGDLVPRRDAGALAKALVKALQAPEARRRAAVRNRAVILERGTWDGNMATMDRAYRELIGARVHGADTGGGC